MTSPAHHPYTGQSRVMDRANLADSVRNLSFDARMQAYCDFDAVLNHRNLARWNRRHKPLGWAGEFHLHMRQAIRFWRFYAKAVRQSARLHNRKVAA